MDVDPLDRESPAAKTQKLDNHSPTGPSSSDISDTQVDGQVEEDAESNVEIKKKAEISNQPKEDKCKTEKPKITDLTPEPRPSTSIDNFESSAKPVKNVVDSPQSEEKNSIYHVKWIRWGAKNVAIITQNENGPCPLLSIVNVLLLRGKLTLPEGCEVISAEQLLEYIGELISESVPGNLADEGRLNYEQNVMDAMWILPKLQTGLDVNVRFNGVSEFEYTPECIIFDLLDIPLYHGWLIDPQQEEVCSAVNSSSYNQLVEMIIANKTSKDSELVSVSLTAQQFLEESASQLTYHGLCELNSTLKDGELAVFFRNNHFSTIYKRKMELFLLVTDQGFLKEPRVVWETLNSIDGDNQFVDEGFLTVTPTAEESATHSAKPVDPSVADLPPDKQIDRDLQLAMTLAREEETEAGEWEDFKRTHLGDTSGLTDEELAQRMQAAEENLAGQGQQQQNANSSGQESNNRESQRQRSRGRTGNTPQQPTPSAQSHSRSRNCAIL